VVHRFLLIQKDVPLIQGQQEMALGQMVQMSARSVLPDMDIPMEEGQVDMEGQVEQE